LGGIVSGAGGRVTNDMPCPASEGKKLLDFPGPDLVETSPRIGPRTDAGPRARSLTLTVTEDRTHADGLPARPHPPRTRAHGPLPQAPVGGVRRHDPGPAQQPLARGPPREPLPHRGGARPDLARPTVRVLP